MTYRQYLYVSFASRPMSDDDLRDLLREAREFNREHGITGFLIYIERQFMQCIEGTAPEIGQLVENIRDDDRNHGFTRLFDRNVTDRAFPDWSMGFQALTLESLRRENAFRNLKSVRDFDRVERHEESIFAIMRGFYAANSGEI